MTPPKTTIKFKLNMRGLDIIQTVYVFLMGLGLREAFLASYDIVLRLQSLSWPQETVLGLLFLNLLFLSVRFFWVPRSFRRLYFLSEVRRSRDGVSSRIRPAETSLHLFIILVHSAIYFLLCRQFAYFAFVSTAYKSYSQTALATYVLLHALLLIFNALWLIYISMRMDRIRRTIIDLPPFLESKSESWLWSRNNLICSLLAVAPLVVFTSCNSGVVACISVAFPADRQPFAIIPTSVVNIAFFIEYFVFEPLKMIWSEPIPSDFVVGFWALGWLMINSIWDLFVTAHYYINLEEIEEEQACDTDVVDKAVKS